MQTEKRVERRETKKSDMVICHLAEMPGELKKVLSVHLYLLPLVLHSEVQEVLVGLWFGGVLLSSD